MAYLDKTVWSVLLEVEAFFPKYEKWTPKPKERTRAVKNRHKNVYKLLQVVNVLSDILEEVITLLDYGLFYDSGVLSFQSDNVFLLQHATKFVDHLYTLQKPFDYVVKSKRLLRSLYEDATCTKERHIRDVISHMVNFYFKHRTLKNIDTKIVKERAAKIEGILQKEFFRIFKNIVLLALSGNYVPVTDCEFEQLFFCNCLTPFEFGSFAPFKLLEKIVELIEKHEDI